MPKFFSACSGLEFPVGITKKVLNATNGTVETIEARRFKFTPLPGGITNEAKGFRNHNFGVISTDDPEVIETLKNRGDVYTEEQFMEIATPAHVRAADEKKRADALARENEKLKAMLAGKAKPQPDAPTAA